MWYQLCLLEWRLAVERLRRETKWPDCPHHGELYEPVPWGQGNLMLFNSNRFLAKLHANTRMAFRPLRCHQSDFDDTQRDHSFILSLVDDVLLEETPLCVSGTSCKTRSQAGGLRFSTTPPGSATECQEKGWSQNIKGSISTTVHMA